MTWRRSSTSVGRSQLTESSSDSDLAESPESPEPTVNDEVADDSEPELLHEEGANVVILHAPRHGRAKGGQDRIGSVSNVGPLRAYQLRDYADEAVDIAQGLGEEVRVLGLSMGGVLAAWTAQERSDVTRVVAVAPAISIPGTPSFVTTAFVNLFDELPNVSLPGEASLDLGYAGESTKGLVATLLRGRSVQASASDRGPATDDVVIVINPDDDQIDRGDVEAFAENWAAHDGRVRAHYLPEDGLPHDVIDVDQPDGNTDLIYPILLDLLIGSPE